MKKMRFFLLLLILGFFAVNPALAQNAKLGIQGILKKANGNAVDDGTYSLTFKLYNVSTGGTALWSETQADVEVASGIYTATLGSANPLNIPFNETYYLGVTVGSTTEMLPRIQLTTAPYALSLIGNTNQFPSSGTVKADNEIISGKLTVGQTTQHSTSHAIMTNGGILARGGAPGSGGGSNNGYAFTGGSGDNDSGLFSTADGQVSLYTNNTERLQATASGVQVTGNLTSSTADLTVDDNLNLTGGKTIKYNGQSDWRLVDLDDFLSGSADGWTATTNLTSGTTSAIENVSYGSFNGNVIRPTGSSNNPVLKKQFNLSGAGSYNYVKVVFKYYFTDSWDYNNDVAIAGFSTSVGDANPVICWSQTNNTYSTQGTGNYTGSSTWSDVATIGQMVANTSATSFYVFVGMRSDDDTGNERYAVGNIEVWVR